MTAHLPRRPSILIVDDSPGVLQTMEFLLSPHLPVRVADSGQAALAALTPDTALVLTDVRMPGMNGVELARTLRRTHPHLPVVFMTGIVEDDLRAEARELGVLDVLRKPLRPGVLFPALQEWLADSAATLQATSPPASPLPASAAPATPDTTPTPLPATRPDAATPPPSVPAPTLADPADTDPADTAARRAQQAAQAQMFTAGLNVLPGVTAAWAFDPAGVPLNAVPLDPEVGAYVRFLGTAAHGVAHHLQAAAPVRAVQLEFQDRVLVVCPVPFGYVAVVVRDTPGASSVKSWMRARLSHGLN
ncbi:response regulator [Deinococcus depolymerans]|uniref:Response regulatory domain-containing protein n=1 Tax=Deinococcus depolymerans TaxID=392408 RepID=A0ABP3MKZ5_9DEIO